MKRTIFLTLISCLSITVLIAQDKKDTNTKMDKFLSKTGIIVKFEDYNLDGLKLSYGIADTKIRKFYSGGETTMFYQISSKGQYSTKTASIAYEDLLELQKALQKLKNQVLSDINIGCDYLENKFITDDGVQVGYFVSKGKVSWYMTLEKYGKGNAIFIKDYDTIKSAFDTAQVKMEQL